MRWSGGRSQSSSIVFGKRIKSLFLSSDFHKPELCNWTNMYGCPPALQSLSWEAMEECPCIPVCQPQITLQFTLALGSGRPPYFYHLWSSLDRLLLWLWLFTSYHHLCAWRTGGCLSLCSELGRPRGLGQQTVGKVWRPGRGPSGLAGHEA